MLGPKKKHVVIRHATWKQNSHLPRNTSLGWRVEGGGSIQQKGWTLFGRYIICFFYCWLKTPHCEGEQKKSCFFLGGGVKFQNAVTLWGWNIPSGIPKAKPPPFHHGSMTFHAGHRWIFWLEHRPLGFFLGLNPKTAYNNSNRWYICNGCVSMMYWWLLSCFNPDTPTSLRPPLKPPLKLPTFQPPEVQCFRSFNVVHHGNWFALVRWRLGIRKQHQNGVVSPFLQLCQKLTIQVVKRDRTDTDVERCVEKVAPGPRCNIEFYW